MGAAVLGLSAVVPTNTNVRNIVRDATIPILSHSLKILESLNVQKIKLYSIPT